MSNKTKYANITVKLELGLDETLLSEEEIEAEVKEIIRMGFWEYNEDSIKIEIYLEDYDDDNR